MIRALDLAANEYQGGADGVAAWNPDHRPVPARWPAQVNDLQFLTGPVDRRRRRAARARRCSRARPAWTCRRSTRPGAPASTAWPRLHRRLDGRHAAGWHLRPARDRRRREQGGGGHHPPRHRLRLRDRRRRLRAGVLAALPPRQCQLRRLRARRRRARAGPSDWRSPPAELAFDAPGDDLLCGTRREVRGRAVGLAHRRCELRLRRRDLGRACARRGGRSPGGHRCPRARSATWPCARWTSRATSVAPPRSTPAPRPPRVAAVPRARVPGGAAPSKRCLPAKLGVSARRSAPCALAAASRRCGAATAPPSAGASPASASVAVAGSVLATAKSRADRPDRHHRAGATPPARPRPAAGCRGEASAGPASGRAGC